MRRPVKKRNQAGPDIKFGSVKVEKFINTVMKSGAKETARGVVYRALDEVKEKTKTDNPLEIFETAIKNVGPLMEVRSRRVGGANYQVPREVPRAPFSARNEMDDGSSPLAQGCAYSQGSGRRNNRREQGRGSGY